MPGTSAFTQIRGSYGVVVGNAIDLLLERVEMVDVFGNFVTPSARWPCLRLVVALVSLLCAVSVQG